MQKKIKSNQIKYLIIFIFLGDLVVIFSGLVIGHWLRFKSRIGLSQEWTSVGVGSNSDHSLESYAGLIIFGSVLLSTTYLANDLYHPKNILRFKFAISTIVRAIVLWFVTYLGLSLVLKFDPPISRLYAACSALVALTATVLWRLALSSFIRSTGLSTRLSKRVAFLGWSSSANKLAKVLQEDRENVYLFVGYITDNRDSTYPIPPQKSLELGEIQDLNQILRSHMIDVLIKTDLSDGCNNLIRICNECDREMVEFKMIPNRFHLMITGLHVENIVDVPVLGVAEGPLERPVSRILKRIVDIVGAVVGLIISVPLILIFGTIVFCESQGPVIYSQRRVGRKGKTFKIFKIRSMRLDAELKGGAQWAKKNDDRRLRIGAIMRATNIDEVPQFWNVLKGEMSLVGPRPERPELISRFQDEIPHYNARHTVKPGITGWAQINGWRGDTDLTERIRYDLYYIEKWTLLGDFIIMFRTLCGSKNAY